MHIPKKYGESKADNCPFCGRISMMKNKQGIPVCKDHKDEELKDLKCACGEWLDISTGKYGSYFRCMNCGNINFKKAIEANPQIKKNIPQPKSDYQNKNVENKNYQNKKSEKNPREITITSDQLDYMY